jgi:hypothetical protein
VTHKGVIGFRNQRVVSTIHDKCGVTQRVNGPVTVCDLRAFGAGLEHLLLMVCFRVFRLYG